MRRCWAGKRAHPSASDFCARTRGKLRVGFAKQEASVKAAVKRGNKLSTLLGLLQARLRCESQLVLDALMSSARFKPYLRARLAPDVAAVDVSKLDAFMAELKWAGLGVESRRGEAFGERRVLSPVEHPNASPVLGCFCAALQGEAFENPVEFVDLRSRMLRPYKLFCRRFYLRTNGK